MHERDVSRRLNLHPTGTLEMLDEGGVPDFAEPAGGTGDSGAVTCHEGWACGSGSHFGNGPRRLLP